MTPPTDPVGLVRTFLDRIRPNAQGLLDPFGADIASPGQSGSRPLPVRLRGLLAQHAEKNQEITRAFEWQRGAITQEFISRGTFKCSAYDAKVRELFQKAEADRSSLREQWYCGLAPPEQVAFDNHCLAVAGAVLLPLFPPDLPDCLRAPLARLALEYAEVVQRADAERKESEKCLANRGWKNRTVVESILGGITRAEEEARSRLEGRWFRELTPEQQTAFDSSAADRSPARSGHAEGGSKKPRRGRKTGSRTAETDTRLYRDWKAAHDTTGITKGEFIRERGLPASAHASLERGRANVKRERNPGRKGTDESSQAPTN